MRKSILFMIAFGATIAGGATWAALVQRSNPERLETPAGLPIGARDLLYARPFTLERAYPYAWRAEHPQVDAGWLLVIQTDPTLCIPSQEYERVLYVGAQTAERINTGRDSGRIVAVVPAARGASGEPDFDPAATVIFWGSPRLPEEVDARIARSELTRALSAGIAAIPSERIAAARASGGAALAFDERDRLVRHAAELIERFAPAEAEFARGLLAPRVR